MKIFNYINQLKLSLFPVFFMILVVACAEPKGVLSPSNPNTESPAEPEAPTEPEIDSEETTNETLLPDSENPPPPTVTIESEPDRPPFQSGSPLQGWLMRGLETVSCSNICQINSKKQIFDVGEDVCIHWNVIGSPGDENVSIVVSLKDKNPLASIQIGAAGGMCQGVKLGVNTVGIYEANITTDSGKSSQMFWEMR